MLRDVGAIAALHADSWRRNYRGAYLDSYLDGDVMTDRLVVWCERITRPDPSFRTIVAERDGAFAGFAHTTLDDDPTWGALLENLHVLHELKGQGIGTQLMAASARAVLDSRPGAGLYLWVLDQNAAAQAFYEDAAAWKQAARCAGHSRAAAPRLAVGLCGPTPRRCYSVDARRARRRRARPCDRAHRARRLPLDPYVVRVDVEAPLAHEAEQRHPGRLASSTARLEGAQTEARTGMPASRPSAPARSSPGR